MIEHQDRIAADLGSEGRQLNFVTIIIAGEVFKTLKETLASYPETLLGSQRIEDFWEEDRAAYVFRDRCRLSFESILYFYQSKGTLSQPKNVHYSTFTDEVEFFQIPRESLRIVNTGTGSKRTTTMRNGAHSALWRYKTETPDSKKIIYPPSNVRYTRLYSTIFGGRTWTYKVGQVIMACDLVATLLFVFCHIVSTINMEKVMDDHGEDPHIDEIKLIPEPIGSIIEAMCVFWIMIHYFAGLAVAEEKVQYVKSFMSMVDAIIVVAVILDNILSWLDVTNPTSMPLRAIGVLRLFNLARHSTLLYCLGLALRQSFSDLIHVLFVIVFIMFLAAGFVYFAEQPPCGQYNKTSRVCSYNASLDPEQCIYNIECSSNKTKYVSIFASSYWAAVTITTVGYGDMIPKTTFGKLVGSVLALIGLPLIAIPMPLIMTKFEKLYTTVKEQQNESRKQEEEKLFNRNKDQSSTSCNNWHSRSSRRKQSAKYNKNRPPPSPVGEKDPNVSDMSDNSFADESITINVQPKDPSSTSPLSSTLYHQISENGDPVLPHYTPTRSSATPPSWIRSPDLLEEERGRGSPSWTESWKELYGRCPTGNCNESGCKSCHNNNKHDNNNQDAGDEIDTH